MHRQLVLVAIACLTTAGCAKNSATVSGDPFLDRRSDFPVVAEQVDTVTNGQIPAIGSPEQVIGVDAPDGTQIRQTIFVDRDGQEYGDAQVLSPSTTPPPDKSEWWKSQAVVDAAAKDGFEIPPTTSAQGRVGHASISYGMGQLSKP